MGSVSVSSCRCCMFVSCVHPVAVLNAACSLLMQVEDGRGILQKRSHNCLVGVSCLPHPVAVNAFMICRGCVRVLRCCGWVCCM